MTSMDQRWGFGYRLALAPSTLATLLARRDQWREELVGWRLGHGDAAPLLVPELLAVYAHSLEGATGGLARLRRKALRIDQPERLGGGQSALCVEHANGPRVLAPQALGVPADAAAGAGVRVAVVDSGIDLAHADFQGARIAASAAFVGVHGVQDGSSDSHGSACAGIIAGPRQPFDGGCRYGIASDARLLIAKAMHDNGSAHSFTVEIAVAWAVRMGADIVSLSLGFERARDAPPSVLARSLSRLSRRHRVLIVAAAGNGDPTRDGIKNPAAGRHVLAVGALDLAGQVRRDSLRGDAAARIFCVAPGANVVAPRREADPHSPQGARHFFNGTSAAVPVVAGLAALLKGEHGACCADLLAGELARRCAPLTLGSAHDWGHGRVQFAPL